MTGDDFLIWLCVFALIYLGYSKGKDKKVAKNALKFSIKGEEFQCVKVGQYYLIEAVIVALNYDDLDAEIHCIKHFASVDKAVKFCQRHFGLKEDCAVEFDEQQCAYFASGFNPVPPAFVKRAFKSLYSLSDDTLIEKLIIKKGALRCVFDDEKESFHRLEKLKDMEIEAKKW